jgi:fructose-bisphosphate aldolase class II
VSVPSYDEYLGMLDAAAGGGYAFPAVNVSSSETLNAALRGFAEAKSDGIVEVTTGGASYLSGATAGNAVAGARGLAAFVHEVARSYEVLVAVHTDHCPAPQVDSFLRPLLADALERSEAGGRPLFNSHMFDGSTLPLEENLALASELLEACRHAGVVLEVECGVVGGEEDDVSGEGVANEKLYTTDGDLLRVAEVLGTGDRGRYLLAATFGNMHGVYAPGHVHLRPEILCAGQAALHGVHPAARFQYVFHGSSGSSEDDLQAAIRCGVVKVNVDTDMQYAFTRAVADHVLTNYAGVLKVDGGLGDKAAYDPRAWGREGEAAMARAVAERCELLGSAGRSIG